MPGRFQVDSRSIVDNLWISPVHSRALSGRVDSIFQYCTEMLTIELSTTYPQSYFFVAPA